jgi:hypothetical protein
MAAADERRLPGMQATKLDKKTPSTLRLQAQGWDR